MKIGYRKPSVKKSLSARTTGRAKRSVKRATNPLYGKKGMGVINNPKKAVYNKVYNKTTTSVVKSSSSKSSSNSKYSSSPHSTSRTSLQDGISSSISENDNSFYQKYVEQEKEKKKNDTKLGCMALIFLFSVIGIILNIFIFIPLVFIVCIILFALSTFYIDKTNKAKDKKV